VRAVLLLAAHAAGAASVILEPPILSHVYARPATARARFPFRAERAMDAAKSKDPQLPLCRLGSATRAVNRPIVGFLDVRDRKVSLAIFVTCSV
jgi:hypothetical protein